MCTNSIELNVKKSTGADRHGRVNRVSAYRLEIEGRNPDPRHLFIRYKLLFHSFNQVKPIAPKPVSVANDLVVDSTLKK